MTATRLSLELKSLEQLLRGQQNLLREEQTRFVQQLLTHTEYELAKAPEPDVRLHDPWADKPAVRPGLPAGPSTSRYQIINYGTSHYPVDAKGTSLNSPVTENVQNSPMLPRYKSIVRLGPNTLAENDRTLKYLPYFIEEEQGIDKEELYKELSQRFDKLPEDLHVRRNCSEKAVFWREAIEELMVEVGVDVEDVMCYLLMPDSEFQSFSPRNVHQKAIEQWRHRENSCKSCAMSYSRGSWNRVYSALPKPSRDRISIVVAGFLCQAVTKVAEFSIWHVVSKHPRIRQLLQEARTSSSQAVQIAGPQTASKLRCALCYLHDCHGHGAFTEHDDVMQDEEEAMDAGSESENELKQNVREMINTAGDDGARDKPPKSFCGVYCVDSSTRLAHLLGIDFDGEVRGICNEQFRDLTNLSIFEDTAGCSEQCFWKKTNRRRDETINHLMQRTREAAQRWAGWDQASIAKYWVMLKAVGKKKRGACVIAKACSVSCYRIWEQIIIEMQLNHQPHPLVDQPIKDLTIRDKNWWQENSTTHILDQRAPFIPCSHEGPCDGNQQCTCWKEKVACEHVCKCPDACARRFRGCKCKSMNKGVCFGDDRCECYALNRECDPWLCGNCGVVEVLDPANRHNDSICRGRCKNAALQRDVPKRTLKNHSEVQGWGLFAGEDIKANDFIGEYKGEIISSEESDRRGAVYHHRGVEYLFRLNRDQEVDSTRAGNKMRFINNSQLKRNINCFARLSFCNGVQRIGLYAKRDIKAGEELFFNYGYPESVTKAFWEKGEKGPGNHADYSSDESDDDTRRREIIAAKEQRKKASKSKKGKAVPIPRRPTAELNALFSGPRRTSSRPKKRRWGYEEGQSPNFPQYDGPSSSRVSSHLSSSREEAERSPEISESSDAAEDNEDSFESVDSDSDLRSTSRKRRSFDSASDDEDESGNSDPVSLDFNSKRHRPTKPTQGPKPKKKKKVKTKPKEPSDTRYGGQAQKLGWITRKKNMAARKRMERKRDKMMRMKGKGKTR
ncbi:putative esc e complex protein [Phaeomoniella chlamydospora]|uniref:Putative esc e complex protein n=1 Tax=Phaeomoniella chlamydospora TaxID=158046 RepID=A0A0G2F3K1_PHACM|nr:putative esc e complex protein [Phaeomoniella chlamydospora]